MNFACQPRSLEELKLWKATEFRQFLLYTGPVDLKDVVNNKIYVHAFSPASSQHKTKDLTNIAYAKNLLTFFVQKAPEFYGKKILVYNVHNLISLHQDVDAFS